MLDDKNRAAGDPANPILCIHHCAQRLSSFSVILFACFRFFAFLLLLIETSRGEVQTSWNCILYCFIVAIKNLAVIYIFSYHLIHKSTGTDLKCSFEF